MLFSRQAGYDSTSTHKTYTNIQGSQHRSKEIILTTSPQIRQWCFRVNTPNSFPQRLHPNHPIKRLPVCCRKQLVTSVANLLHRRRLPRVFVALEESTRLLSWCAPLSEKVMDDYRWFDEPGVVAAKLRAIAVFVHLATFWMLSVPLGHLTNKEVEEREHSDVWFFGYKHF